VTSLTLYTARGSAVEAVDPRAKIVAAVLVVGALVVADWFPLKAAIVAFLIVLWFTARLSAKVLAITSVSLSFFFLTTLVLRAIRQQISFKFRPERRGRRSGCLHVPFCSTLTLPGR
jgi:energy-coupling factor transporter transmembrane protein EcfT